MGDISQEIVIIITASNLSSLRWNQCNEHRSPAFLHVQEHFVPRLKGGVFILNRFEGVALFKNFLLRECNNFGQNGTCLEGISSMIY